jgi:glucokinase
MAVKLYVGLDVGGTTMKAAVVSEAGQPLTPDPFVLDTNASRGQDEGLKTMAATIRGAMAAAKVELADIAAIGVATPGLMDIRAGLILDPPNLKPWQNVPVRKFIEDEFGFKDRVAFQNDANAAAYGEFWVGAGKEASSLVLFTLGTGVGGGIILGDLVLEGKHSHGGELGHLRIESPATGRLCGCGHRGCLEAYASATSVRRRTREALASYRAPSSLKQYFTAPDTVLTSKLIFEHAKTDDLAKQIVDDTAYYLGLGCSAAMATIDPEMIAIGGGMADAGEGFMDQIREYAIRFGLPHPAKGVVIRHAELGSDAGFIGAAGCARLLAK